MRSSYRSLRLENNYSHNRGCLRVDKFIGLSGLPRSGSTLLSAILDQNPAIHAEGNSSVCQLMWDMHQSCYGASSEQLSANNRQHTIHDMVASVPRTYYKGVTAPVIIDKCRSWTNPSNMNLLATYTSNSPKVIVLERPVIDVVKSFVSQKIRNGTGYNELLEDLYIENSEPIIRSLNGVNWAKQNNKGEFLFIQYDALIEDTQDVLSSIYAFCELEPFTHDLSNIVDKHPENDAVYNATGLHDIRTTISRRKIEVELPDGIIKRCAELESAND